MDKFGLEITRPDIINLDTLSESSSLRQEGNSIEALALNEIVKNIMNSECDEQKHRTEQTNPKSKNP